MSAEPDVFAGMPPGPIAPLLAPPEADAPEEEWQAFRAAGSGRRRAVAVLSGLRALEEPRPSDDFLANIPDPSNDPGWEAGTVAAAGGRLVSWRTLADISDAPPRELHLGVIEPDGPNLLYGPPGVGKGSTASWIVVESQRLGMRPLIYDAERRPREWARRVSGLGGDRSRVLYLEPPDLGPTCAGRPLWDVTPAIGSIIRAAGCDLLIVDSILPAVGVGEERLRSDAQAPDLYVAALDALGVPSLSLGHPPKGQPEGDPFGSVAWLGAMRLTWLGTADEGEGHRVRWRPRKRNERGHIPGFVLSFSYGDDGRLCSVERVDDEESTREWIIGALAHGPRTVPDLAEDMHDESSDPPAGEAERIAERLGRMLRRMAREGSVRKAGTAGRAVRWELATA